MKLNCRYSLIIVLVCIGSCWGIEFTKLAGDLPREITATQGPYLVTGDIYVTAGKVTTIESGTIFLFKNFTGLHVQGTLEVKGTAEWPVVFTSEYDQNYNAASKVRANPYDWNGIYIHSDAFGTTMEHFEVLYSVYGINSQTKFIRIEAGTFHYNGRANLFIEEKEIIFGNGPFSYSLSVKDAKIAGVPINILDDPNRVKRSVVRYAGIGLFFSGVIFGIIENSQFISDDRRFKEIQVDLVNYHDADRQAAQSKRTTSAVYMGIGYFIGLIGAAGFYWSFTF